MVNSRVAQFIWFTLTAYISHLGGSRVRVWQHMVSAQRKPITWVWVYSPQRGPETEPLVRVSSPLKFNAYLHYHNLRDESAMCTKICF